MVSPGGNTVRQPAMPTGAESKQREVGAVVKMEPPEYFSDQNDAFMPDGERQRYVDIEPKLAHTNICNVKNICPFSGIYRK